MTIVVILKLYQAIVLGLFIPLFIGLGTNNEVLLVPFLGEKKKKKKKKKKL